MDRKYYEAYDDRYHQVHAEDLCWFAETPSQIVLDIIDKYSVKGSLLEIGCGEGRDSRILLERGFNLLATDVSPEAIAYCRRKWPKYVENFQILDCVGGQLRGQFDFIYAVAVLHMLVSQEDRSDFYRFIREHLKECGIALICTMGDGVTERSSDISKAFDLQERIHDQTGKTLWVAGTSYKGVSFEMFDRELTENGLEILEQGITDVEPDYWKMMYAVVKRR